MITLQTKGEIEFTVEDNFEGTVEISNMQIRADGVKLNPHDSAAGLLGHVDVDDLLVFLSHYLAHKIHQGAEPLALVRELVEPTIKL